MEYFDLVMKHFKIEGAERDGLWTQARVDPVQSLAHYKTIIFSLSHEEMQKIKETKVTIIESPPMKPLVQPKMHRRIE